jgi:hypothetical protein
MMVLLVDTDILIDSLRGVETAIARLEREEEQTVIAISSITRKELLLGCADKMQQRKVLKFLQRFRLIRITAEIDAKADMLLEHYTLSHGLLIADALIAATAQVTDCPLLSKNQKDFKFIEGLCLLPYP